MNTVILCARQTSTRLPGKALVTIEGHAMLEWIIKRYQASRRVDRIVVSTPRTETAIIEACDAWNVPCYGGDEHNVVAQMDGALKAHAPESDTVFRGLGDMPLFDVDLLDWRYDLMDRYGSDLCWVGKHDDPLPVYGSRESPWSRHAWDAIVANSEGYDCEHPGQWLYSNLRHFRVTHTETLLAEYYRPYRLELDTPDDLRFFLVLYKQMLFCIRNQPGTLDVLRWLDAHENVVLINAKVETKTLTRANFKQRGVEWICDECGTSAMVTGIIRRNTLTTTCERCGKERTFKPVPPFVARRLNR